MNEKKELKVDKRVSREAKHSVPRENLSENIPTRTPANYKREKVSSARPSGNYHVWSLSLRAHKEQARSLTFFTLSKEKKSAQSANESLEK